MNSTPAGNRVSPALHIARVPGELGPVIRCSGELTVATGEALKRQIDLLASLHLPFLVLNVGACRFLDTDGVMLLLDTYRRLQEQGTRFAVVSGKEAASQLLHLLAIDTLIPTFPTEASAALAFRGGAPTPAAPATWAQARADSLAMWRSIQELLKDGDLNTAAMGITTNHGLCRRAELCFQEQGAQDNVRCHLCPLFYALGARTEDIGCGSITQPMLEALCNGNRSAALAEVSRLVRLIETMPLPQNDA